MKSVLISIQPKWCELIANGKKTVEVRKTKPKLETPFKVYIYCTKGQHEALWKYGGQYYYDTQFPNERPNKANGKVIGEFVCDRIYEIGYDYFYPCGYEVSKGEISRKELYEKSCLSFNQMDDYLNMELGYAWHISNLVIYDEPRELSEFVVEGDCLNGDCKKCKWFDGGNNYNVEADCLLPYDFHFKKTVKPLFRPPQSWCYVESEVDTE